jgi:hypothetical protein
MGSDRFIFSNTSNVRIEAVPLPDSIVLVVFLLF